METKCGDVESYVDGSSWWGSGRRRCYAWDGAMRRLTSSIGTYIVINCVYEFYDNVFIKVKILEFGVCLHH